MYNANLKSYNTYSEIKKGPKPPSSPLPPSLGLGMVLDDNSVVDVLMSAGSSITDSLPAIQAETKVVVLWTEI